jgi:hypothetical protein
MTRNLRNWAVISLAFLWLPAVHADSRETSAPARRQFVQAYGNLAMSFEANQGETDRQVRFVARGRGYDLFLTRGEAVLSLQKNCAGTGDPTVRRSKASCLARSVLRVGLAHASRGTNPEGVNELASVSNYFIGSDPGKWHRNVPRFAGVKYANVYPGIDVVYHGNQRQLEYDFLVAPGADPAAIELTFRNSRKLTVNTAGDLVVSLGDSEWIDRAPVIYQETEGRRHVVAGRYVLLGKNRVGFSVATYDQKKSLVIDPVLSYSTYLGGSAFDDAFGVAVDASGNAYIAGYTSSLNFPISSHASQTNSAGGFDAFVCKLNADGSALVYCTYLGGSSDDLGLGIAIDSAGNAYVTGNTGSFDFPTTSGAVQTTYGGGFSDAFVSKLNAAGSELIYSTYLGGNDLEEGFGIAVDALGNAYITGDTNSLNFPTTSGAFQTVAGGGGDSFVTKLNSDGSALVYSTYLGGNEFDTSRGLAVDSSGNTYVEGSTVSLNFPTTPGALQTNFGGGSSDDFVSKLNTAGSGLIYSTYLGGNDFESGFGLAIDGAGNAYVTGVTGSANFPTTSGAFQTMLRGVDDVFVSKLNAEGSALIYSTYLGGSAGEFANSLALDDKGGAYVTGFTGSNDFPTTPGAFQNVYGDGGDVFVSRLNTEGSALTYSTYLGGTGADFGGGIAVDSEGSVYVTGVTNSANFPTSAGALQTTFGGGTNDAFVSKLKIGGIPFSSFNGKLALNSANGSFDLNASFTLGTGGNINPVTEPVTLTIGTYSVTIPADSFAQKKPGYTFQGVINGATLNLLIKFGDTAGSYRFQAEGRGVNLTGTTNPVTVTLSIGDNSGNTNIEAVRMPGEELAAMAGLWTARVGLRGTQERGKAFEGELEIISDGTGHTGARDNSTRLFQSSQQRRRSLAEESVRFSRQS